MTFIERLMSVVAFALLVVFLSVLIAYVPRFDLGAVLLVTILLCGYDLFLHKVPPHNE
ncbi:MAG TPA: hypothetical protein VIN77_09445 [Aurantimonas sp.]|uniref:Uncharacterized protein n=1 Tax=Aurantimonas marianensis TaxID=2920428 RepID=A0A9X2H8F5_9HYPH|nr:hypothetical protein [Aurantimonas marianensis]MCP3055663.1 hypothetical protein [Aurantimonas marianensis]